jgi:ERCC4-type nuclease
MPRNDRLEIAYSRLVPTDREIFQPDTNHPPEFLIEGGWQVVLYVDNHERNNANVMGTQKWVDELNSKMQNRYQELRTHPHVELKSLAAGDYLWVAKKGTAVRVLDYCVERKTMADLDRCLTTTSVTYPNIVKMGHQMRQLRYSGISIPIILVEGNAEPTKCVKTVCREIRTGERPGFSLVETNDLLDTQRWLLRYHNLIRGEMRAARPKTVDKLETSVTKAMECPKFKFYNSLLLLSRVGESTALEVVKKYETEESLRQTLNRDPNDVYSTVVEGAGGRPRKISGTAADSIQSKFGSCTMVPPAAARMRLAASIPPSSQSNKRSLASTTSPRPPSRTPWAESQSDKRSPAAANLGSFKKKPRFSTPLRTDSMASPSKSPIDVNDCKEPRFEDDLQSAIRNSLQKPSLDDTLREPDFDDNLRAAIRNSLQKEPTFDDNLQSAIRNSRQEPSLFDDDLQTAIRNSLQEPGFGNDLQAAIRNSRFL